MDHNPINPGSFGVHFDTQSGEYVGTHTGFPSLSWLDPWPEGALDGIRHAVAEARVDIVQERNDADTAALSKRSAADIAEAAAQRLSPNARDFTTELLDGTLIPTDEPSVTDVEEERLDDEVWQDLP